MKKLLIYLDNCCFNRPYDVQNLISIFLETQAKLSIQEMIRYGKINLAWSFILDFENNANPDEIIKREISCWRNFSSIMINKNANIVVKAKELVNIGISKKDALHVAAAIEGQIDFFITVDKGILKKRKFINDITLYSPIDFINLIEDNLNEN